MPGFQTLPFNELSSVEKITSDICAVIVEPVQGEGGIHSCTPEFISALKIKCNEVGALLIYDEIQVISKTNKSVESAELEKCLDSRHSAILRVPLSPV